MKKSMHKLLILANIIWILYVIFFALASRLPVVLVLVLILVPLSISYIIYKGLNEKKWN